MSAKAMDKIASLLKAVKFKKKLFGGVDEDHVWRVLKRLQKEYRRTLDSTEQHYRALLEERNDIILKQKKQIARMKTQQSPLEGGVVNGRSPNPRERQSIATAQRPATDDTGENYRRTPGNN